MDREELADFLRTRREALQPEDVGLVRGSRRRTSGLRREEVAALSDMSVDYYSRLEQQRGPQPSVQMLGALARGLRLTIDERDHLFHLAGHHAPTRPIDRNHVSPAMMRILDRLSDTPAQVMTALAETLVQTPAARALFGDETRFTGLQRSLAYRWFTDPDARQVYPDEDHDQLSRGWVADTRAVHAKHGPKSRAATIINALLTESPEFAALWRDHEVAQRYEREKRLQHREVGQLELQCQVLIDPESGQSLLVMTASPGTESYDKLQLLNVIGTQNVGSS